MVALIPVADGQEAADTNNALATDDAPATPGLREESSIRGFRGLKEMNPPRSAVNDKVTALVGGKLIDGRGGDPVENATVVIHGEKIVAVGGAGTPVPEGADVIDVRGQSILPGLVDSHFHSINDVDMVVDFQLRNGITSLRDPGHPFKYYSQTLQSKRDMPRIFLCGGHLDAAPAVWPDQAAVIASDADATRAVNAHVDRGASAIKVYFRLPLEHIRVACSAAEQRGVPVTSHLELVEAKDAIDAGVRGVEHVTSFGLSLAEPEAITNFRSLVSADSDARKEWRYRMWADIDLTDSTRLDPLISKLRENRVFVSPTLAVFERRLGQKDATEFEAVAFEKQMKFVEICHENDITVVAGSHTYAPLAKSGKAFLRELQLLVECGMSPLEAITAATYDNARFFGIAERLGSVEVGKTADIVLVRGDPSRDISEIDQVQRVMLNGNWVVDSTSESEATVGGN